MVLHRVIRLVRVLSPLFVPRSSARKERCASHGKRDAMIVRRIATDADMRAFGAELAGRCPPGAVVLLRGPLGAGKTTLADGFITSLGAGHATSPTFTLAHRHDGGRMPIWHLDLFRLEDKAQVEELDIVQYVPADGIALVEWPERAGDIWPPDRIDVRIEIDGEHRIANVRLSGRCSDVPA